MTRKLFVLLLIIVGFIYPLVVPANYFIHLGVLALIWMIVAQGTNIIQGYTGYVSIAQAGFMGIGAYTSALLSVSLGLPVWLTIVIAPFVTAIAAIIAGYPSLRVRGHYFAIVTMALNMVIFTILVNWISLTGGEAGMANIPAPEAISLLGLDIRFDRRIPYYYLVLVTLLAVMALVVAIVRSRVGLVLQAIRQNETFAEAAGISPWRYKLFSFVLSASLAGLAGALYAHYQSFISPAPFSVDHSLNAILAVIIGGSGTILGPVVGSALITALPEVLRMADSYRLIVYGVSLVLVVIFLPRGIVPAVTEWLRRDNKKAEEKVQ